MPETISCQGASDTFLAVVEELASDYGADVWRGSPDELLKRMKASKPGLSTELKKFDSDPSEPRLSTTLSPINDADRCVRTTANS